MQETQSFGWGSLGKETACMTVCKWGASIKMCTLGLLFKH